jgi:hypothetical protein
MPNEASLGGLDVQVPRVGGGASTGTNLAYSALWRP